MSDPSIEMNHRATRGALPLIVLFFLIIIAFNFWNPIVSGLTELFGGDDAKIEDVKELSNLIFPILIGVILSVLLVFVDLNLHQIIDRFTLKLKIKVGEDIRNELEKAAKSLEINGAEDVLADQNNVDDIFYHFVNEQSALRHRAFMLWGKYYQYLYVMLFGLLSIVFSIAYAFFWNSDTLSWWSPVVIAVCLIIYSLSAHLSLIPKIRRLPVQQVSKIRIHNAEEYRNEIRQRLPEKPNSGHE